MSVDTAVVFDEAVLREITAAAGIPPWELIEMFLDDAAGSLDLMDAAIASGDRETVNRVAHSVKSSAGSVGAAKFAAQARDIEQRTKSALDVESVDLCARLRGTLDEFKQRVEADRERLSS